MKTTRIDTIESTSTCLASRCNDEEGVRAYYHGWYQDVLTELPRAENGYVAAPTDGTGAEESARRFGRSSWPSELV